MGREGQRPFSLAPKKKAALRCGLLTVQYGRSLT
ncbi:hypothetical protein SAMN05444714_0545 [Yoonia litorea]|uniref:Uncharacterized protein n=1 Tax=Yoonia litorea TaxID=1123755 RepID=A0A1I6LHC5_9RHOB|nr:hypothetical protein SAMN05444714_0545 [Yoonia litorea]